MLQQMLGQMAYILEQNITHFRKKYNSDTLLHILNKIKYISFVLSKFKKSTHKEKSQS